MDVRNFFAGGALAALLIFAGHAQAAECRVTKSVVDSAKSLSANTTAELRGHYT